MAGQWCLIESDPGVFTELLRGFGCSGLQVEEIWSLEEESFDKLSPVHGLIFLCKWRGGEEPAGEIVTDSRINDIFFAKQVIVNACATLALLSVVLNCSHDDVSLGPALSAFRDFSRQFDPAMKGLALSNSDTIREVHNSFSRQQLLEGEATPGCRDDAFHFVSFVPIGGHLYELDGLKEGPVDLGPCELASWLSAVRPVIERRIQRFQEGEIRFNLMAVVSDRRLVLKNRIEELTGVTMDTGEGGAWPAEIQSELEQMRLQIEEEEKKLQRYRVECARRRHNFLPFILELLRTLAQQQRLLPLVQQAKARQAARKK
uniref:ubiquitin carboxyl-terminal hydrolase isozyme L5 n=1 Tax=Myxine glutinosa TaxID=7769 RepID=UPI00358E1B1E